MLNDHQRAWLSAHTDRSREWLEDRLAEGFDVHHLDGDHQNNDPANLVLIEHMDHMRLHGLGIPARPNPTGDRMARGELAYSELAANPGAWRALERRLGASGATIYKWAKYYASRTGQRWPLPG